MGGGRPHECAHRLLAGRVLGVDAMIDGASFMKSTRCSILSTGSASVVHSTLRPTLPLWRTGQGCNLLARISGRARFDARDGDLTPFWYGQFPAPCRVVKDFAGAGLLKEPRLRPEFLGTPDSQARIAEP